MLIITTALKQELPISWIKETSTHIYTLKALNAGTTPGEACFILITGVGPENSLFAAEWIHNHHPSAIVVNWGTCGHSSLDIGTLIKAATPYCSQKPFQETLPYTIDENFKDMEFQVQEQFFKEKEQPFFSYKVISDHDNHNKNEDFQNSLPLVQDLFKKMFYWLNLTPPTISVVIPVYNRKTSITRAIESVLNQSTLPKEIIVIDDGSTEDIQSALPEQPKVPIVYHKLKQNKGVSAARNKGIELAKGNWVAFLDSDDEWTATKLDSQLNYLHQRPYLQILQSQEKWIRHGKHLNQKKHHQKQSGFIFDYCLERCMIAPSSVLIQKDLFKEVGTFDESLVVCEDYDLWLKISRHYPVGLDKAVSLIKYGGHSDQLSFTYNVMDRFRVQSLTHLLEGEKDPEFKEKIQKLLDFKQSIIKSGQEKRAL